MGKRENRRKELDALKAMFPNDHSQLSVISARFDELHIQFKADHRNYSITCSIPEDYPQDQPLWFSESENGFVSEVLEQVNSSDSYSSLTCEDLTKNVRYILKTLCALFGLEAVPTNGVAVSDESDDDSDDDVDLGLMEDSEIAKKPKLSEDHDRLRKLETLGNKKNRTNESSFQSTDRIMKDLKMIYKSDQFKNGHYLVDIINDDLYHWKITMLKIDEDSALARDLAKLSKDAGKKIDLELECRFDANYPFSPPFIRVLSPHISGGHVTQGGGLCMELLTNQGWSSAYSIESLLIQISASFTAGGARAHKSNSANYTLNHARRGFKSAAAYHKQNGW